jgi:imidazole glycerol-phosphate synthase subunit HisH
VINIINYNCGNIKSIYNMINRIGRDAIITNDPNELNNATKIIHPGVGNFDYGMKMLSKK